MITQDQLEREQYEARVKYQRDAISRIEEAETKGLEKGLEKGLDSGEWIGRIHLCEARLGRPLTLREELAELPLEELRRRAGELEGQLFPS